jgi:hypothetical protein
MYLSRARRARSSYSGFSLVTPSRRPFLRARPVFGLDDALERASVYRGRSFRMPSVVVLAEKEPDEFLAVPFSAKEVSRTPRRFFFIPTAW